MSTDDPSDMPPERIIDHLYDIALDPSALDDFIEKWNDSGFDVSTVRQTIQQIEAFDKSFARHLIRADTFLDRKGGTAPSLTTRALAPFNNSPAMVIDCRLNVAALNTGASEVLCVTQGSHMRDMPFADEQIDLLVQSLQDHLYSPGAGTRLLKLTGLGNGQPILFHMRRLSQTDAEGQPLLLLISTQYFWKRELDETLIEVFQLTQAELGVVRALVEGLDARAVAADRGTSEATVRTQIKSILSKMGARSQSEAIRLVMSLRDVTVTTQGPDVSLPLAPALGRDWLQREAEKPLKTIYLADGRRMDYHDQGPPEGAPILFSHFGLGQLRWTPQMLRLAFGHQLRVICPVRAGYGVSTNIDRNADILSSTRHDTLALLNMLGIERLPYVPQGSDLIFAVDLAAECPDRISEIIGICTRPYLQGDQHYAQMGKWQRFFLSTGKHSPHLLDFTTRAAFSLGRKIGAQAMFATMNKRSAADFRLSQDQTTFPIMAQAAEELLYGENTDASQAYVMEVLVSEADWSDRLHAAKAVPICSLNGAQDPSLDMSVIAAYREQYPWMSFEVFEDAGQMLIFQKPDLIIPRLAASAHAAVPR